MRCQSGSGIAWTAALIFLMLRTPIEYCQPDFSSSLKTLVFENPESALSSLVPVAPARSTRAISSPQKRLIRFGEIEVVARLPGREPGMRHARAAVVDEVAQVQRSAATDGGQGARGVDERVDGVREVWREHTRSEEDQVACAAQRGAWRSSLSALTRARRSGYRCAERHSALSNHFINEEERRC